MKLIISLLFFLNLYSQDNNIICSDGQCSPEVTPTDQLERSFFTRLIYEDNVSDINVNVNGEESPRSLRMSVNHQDFNNLRNINIDLSSNNENFNSGDTILISDILNSININVDGFEGRQGKSAAEICAENIQSGKYGEDIRNSFLNKRQIDQSLPANECTFIDIDEIQNNTFFCDDSAFSDDIDINDPVVQVKRLRARTRCLGLAQVDVCLSKTLKIGCTWKIKFLDNSGYSSSPNDTVTKELRIPEEEYLARQNEANYRDYLCEYATLGAGEVYPPNSLANGDFNLNLNGWTTEDAIRDKGALKFLGGANKSSRPRAYSPIPTEIGANYRVRATFKKDKQAPNDWVSSLSVKIYDSALRDNLLERNEFYEGRDVMQGVWIESSPTYRHFRYTRIGDPSPPNQTFVLTNKDDRTAVNCSPPFLVGDTNDFILTDQNCSNNDLPVGGTCSVSVTPRPSSLGLKTAYIRRNCQDEYGTDTLLNTRVQTFGYSNYEENDFNGVYYRLEGETWKVFGNICRSETVCSGGGFNTTCRQEVTCGASDWWGLADVPPQVPFSSTFFFLESADANPPEIPEICLTDPSNSICDFIEPSDFVSRRINDIPNEFIMPGVPSSPPSIEYPFVSNSQIDPSQRKDQYTLDFVFRAETNESYIEVSPILKFHRGIVDSINIERVSDQAGIPDTDIVAASNGAGNGVWELQQSRTQEFTSPGYDSVFYTLLEGSDWRIQYVGENEACPAFYDKIASSFIAQQIGYDENDNKCDDVSIPEDSENRVFSWNNIGTDRLPEFGTETIECRLENCSVNTSIRDINHSRDVITPGSGVSGTQQGEAFVFVYDYNNFSGSAEVGSVGTLGLDNIAKLETPKLCYRIQDAETEGENSEFAVSPVVYFRRYNWQALKVDNNGNFGNPPEDNGKKIKVFKKLNSFTRYLLEKELF